MACAFGASSVVHAHRTMSAGTPGGGSATCAPPPTSVADTQDWQRTDTSSGRIIRRWDALPEGWTTRYPTWQTTPSWRYVHKLNTHLIPAEVETVGKMLGRRRRRSEGRGQSPLDSEVAITVGHGQKHGADRRRAQQRKGAVWAPPADGAVLPWTDW